MQGQMQDSYQLWKGGYLLVVHPIYWTEIR